MKRLLILVMILISSGQFASAQYFGQFSTAETVYKGSSIGGGYAAIYEHALGILGQYRYGLGGYTDFGIKAGFVDYDNPVGAGGVGGLDIKYQVMETRIKDPLDLSVGGLFNFGVFDTHNILSFGGFVVGSYPVKMRNGRTISPYGRFVLRVDRIDSDNDIADSEFNIGFNMGAALQLSGNTQALAELQFEENLSFFMGLNFGL